MKPTTVHIRKCPDYDPVRVCEAVVALLESEGISKKIPDGGTVLLKPNLLSASKGPDQPVNTHPSIVRAMALYLMEKRNCRVWVGDSCNSLSGSSTAEAFRRMGLDVMAEELGLRLIDFNSDRTSVLQIPRASLWREVRVASSVLEADLLVTLAKMKTHALSGLTLSVKNLVGTVQGGEKRRMHAIAPGPDAFAEVVVDLYGLLRPGLALIDAVTAMEGDGPAGGDAVQVGLLLASADPVAADAVATKIAGMEPEENPVLLKAGERGLGVAQVSDIRIEGEPIQGLNVRPFRRAKRSLLSQILLRWFPHRILKGLVLYLAGHLPRIDKRRCRLCRDCVSVCPADAISMVSGRMKIATEICQECFCCQELCPHDAIDIMNKPIARLLR